MADTFSGAIGATSINDNVVESSTTATDELSATSSFTWAEPDIDNGYSYINAGTCPDCGTGMVRQGNCFSCPSCGWGCCG